MASRGRKIGIALLVVALILGGIFVIIDRIAVWYAEGRVAELVADQAAHEGVRATGDPEVEIGGFPFLTQALGGELSTVTIRIEHAEVDVYRLNDLWARATGVTYEFGELLSGRGPVTATRVRGEVTLPYSPFNEIIYNSFDLASQNITYLELSSNNGALQLRGRGQILGQELTVVTRAHLEVNDGVATIQIDDAQIEDTAPFEQGQVWLEDLMERLSGELPLPQLPYGMVVEDIEVTDAGLRVIASAVDVTLVS